MIAVQAVSSTAQSSQALIARCSTAGCGWPPRYGTASGLIFCTLPGCQRRLLVVRIAELVIRPRVITSGQTDDKATLWSWLDFARRASEHEIDFVLCAMRDFTTRDVVALVSEPVWPWCERVQEGDHE